MPRHCWYVLWHICLSAVLLKNHRVCCSDLSQPTGETRQILSTDSLPVVNMNTDGKLVYVIRTQNTGADLKLLVDIYDSTHDFDLVKRV